MLLTIYKGSYLQLHYSPTERLLVLEWDGCLPSDAFRSEINRSLMCSEEHDVHYWLSDNRRLGPLSYADKNWISADWMPRFAKAKVEKLSVLVLPDIYNLLPIQEILIDSDKYGSFDHKFFFDYPSAMEWLTTAKCNG
jgi:hypothetical protein